MRNYIQILAILIISCSASAQQTPLMSHYMFNGLLLNPAYAGSKEYVSSTLMYRNQWAGIEGAPVTYSATAHGMLKNKKLGLGLILQQDKTGITKQTDIYASMAYHLRMGNSHLSLGLQGGVTNFTSEIVKLSYWDPNDQVYNYNTYSNVLPNAGFGIYFYRTRFYAGLSMPYIVSYDPAQTFSVNSSKLLYKQSRRYLFTSGYVIETGRNLRWKPSVLIKSEDNTHIQADFNLNVLIDDIFWVGASWRSSEAIVALFEFQVSKKFRIGYSYDYTLGQLSNYTSGSHEFMLGYDFGYSVLKMKSPRYF